MSVAYYAFLDNDNYVTEVIPGKEGPIEGLPPAEWYGNYRGQKCVRTSIDGTIHGCYAGIGYYYDETLNQFIPPAPLPDPEPIDPEPLV
jgi:hypothetical protein